MPRARQSARPCNTAFGPCHDSARWFTGVNEHCFVVQVSNLEQSTCITCGAGTEPNGPRTECTECTGSNYSTWVSPQPWALLFACTAGTERPLGFRFGIQCIVCPQVVNKDRTACAPPFSCGTGAACSGVDDCFMTSHCEACSPGSFSLGLQPCARCTDLGKVRLHLLRVLRRRRRRLLLVLVLLTRAATAIPS